MESTLLEHTDAIVRALSQTLREARGEESPEAEAVKHSCAVLLSKMTELPEVRKAAAAALVPLAHVALPDAYLRTPFVQYLLHITQNDPAIARSLALVPGLMERVHKLQSTPSKFCSGASQMVLQRVALACEPIMEQRDKSDEALALYRRIPDKTWLLLQPVYTDQPAESVMQDDGPRLLWKGVTDGVYAALAGVVWAGNRSLIVPWLRGLARGNALMAYAFSSCLLATGGTLALFAMMQLLPEVEPAVPEATNDALRLGRASVMTSVTGAAVIGVLRYAPFSLAPALFSVYMADDIPWAYHSRLARCTMFSDGLHDDTQAASPTAH